MTTLLEELPRSDIVGGALHPSQTPILFGQSTATEQFLNAFNAGRLHHAWLVTGARGIGKATLTWQIAKFLLTTPDPSEASGLFGAPEPAASLTIDPAHPICSRINAGSEPGVIAIRRTFDEKRKRLRQMITVDEIRKLKSFFNLSATDGGRRIVIVDCAEDMNANAANALLKILEEPPKNAYLFLISHQPAKLLPTIRSRCRELRLKALTPLHVDQALEEAATDMTAVDLNALALLSGGSVGEAVKLMNLNGLDLYQKILDILEALPRLENEKVISISDMFTTPSSSGEFEFFVSLLELSLNRLSLSGAKTEQDVKQSIFNETSVFSRLSPNRQAAIQWAELTQELSARLRRGHAVNLDASALILDTFFQIEACAARTAQSSEA